MLTITINCFFRLRFEFTFVNRVKSYNKKSIGVMAALDGFQIKRLFFRLNDKLLTIKNEKVRKKQNY